MISMNKEQTFRFWKATRSMTNIEKVLKKYNQKLGYPSKRTLRRYASAFYGFQEDIPLKKIAENNGWTLDRIEKLHDWWQEYRNINVPGDNSSHEESPHSQQIQKSAKALLSQIDFPFIGDRIKAATAESLLEQPKRERFAGSVLLKGLLGHLQTGGYAHVLQYIKNVDRKDSDNFASCHRLLDSVKTEIEQKYNISIPLIDNEDHGFTISFVQTVCADAIERARGTNHYQGFSYRCDGVNLKFGAYIIYRGIPGEDLKHIEDLHLARRESYSVRKKTKDIADQMKSIGQTQEAIRQNLETFALLSRLPGNCLLCQSPVRQSQLVETLSLDQREEGE